MLNNCIQFEGSPNIPCENIKFPTFSDPENFDNKDFKKFIHDNFNNPNFNFSDEDTHLSEDTFKVAPQQKFVSKYANFHNNFEGLLVYHGLGSGKCMGLDTPILMFDGSSKMVQDVKVDDLLMGDDSKPRKVLSLGRGTDEMYTIKIKSTGEKFVCNSEHILCLKCDMLKGLRFSGMIRNLEDMTYTKDGVFHISVKKFLSFDEKIRSRFSLYRYSPIWEESKFAVSAVSAAKNWIPGTSIPNEYKITSINSRIEFLNQLRKFHNLETLSSDTEYIWLLNSVKGQDNELLYFNIIPNGKDNYYGFTLDGNHRYLIDNNFIVTHNTCTSILVGEAYKAYKNMNVGRNKIIVSLPPSIVQQFKEELVGKLIKDKKTHKEKYVGCVVSNVKYDGKLVEYNKAISKESQEKIGDTSSALEKLMKLKAKEEQSTKVKKKTGISKAQKAVSKLNIENRKQKLIDAAISEYWDIKTHITFINSLVETKDRDILGDITQQLRKGGNIIIIDEIQNLISESGILYDKLVTTLRLFSHNNRIVILSATPIYDKPFEIGLTLNLLNPRIFFPDTREQFDSLFENNKELFYWMCNGYISYFSGGNPENFPFKRIIRHYSRFNQFQEEDYRSCEADALKINTKKMKKMNGNYIRNKKAEQAIFTGYTIHLKKISNIILPTENIKDKSSEMAVFERAVDELKEFYGTFEGAYNAIAGTFSVKLADVADIILNKTEGTSIVFSDLIKYGIKPLSIILNIFGIKLLTTSDILKLENIKKFKELYKEPPYHVIWSGSIPQQNKNDFSRILRSIFNDKENKDGKYIKAILGTTSIMEGITFKNVRNVHIINPWWNESRIQQVMARAIRLNSHKDLEPKYRYVNIYRYYSVFSGYTDYILKTPKDSIYDNPGKNSPCDILTDNIAYNKNLKSIEYERVMKSCAVDCANNKVKNLVRLEEHVIPIDNDNVQIFYVNPSDGKSYIKYNTNKNKYEDIMKKDYFWNEYKNTIDIDSKDTIFHSCDYPIVGGPYKMAKPSHPINILEGINDKYVINENIDCDAYDEYNPSNNIEIIPKLLKLTNNYKNNSKLTTDFFINDNKFMKIDKLKLIKALNKITKTDSTLEKIIKDSVEHENKLANKEKNYINIFDILRSENKELNDNIFETIKTSILKFNKRDNKQEFNEILNENYESLQDSDIMTLDDYVQTAEFLNDYFKFYRDNFSSEDLKAKLKTKK